MEPNPEKPDCFGNLDIVFPMRSHGLRASPETCIMCPHKTECLRAAMKNPKGAEVREEMVDRAYDSGNMGFLQRWSKRKYLHKMKKKG
ncbi:MAG: hypothetical protein R2860_07980 [Desulfobacterales bacterium]|jgi:hypothetical protein